MIIISSYCLPIAISIIVAIGLWKKVPIFEAFTAGATEALHIVVKILPSLVGLMVAVSVFRTSGALSLLTRLLSPLFALFHIPETLIPLSLLRPISGSGSLALIRDLFSRYPPDTLTGRMASVVMGSTETTFYTIAVYFGATGVKKIRHTLVAALFADFTAVVVGCAVTRLFFG